jgi:hypothetical protein
MGIKAVEMVRRIRDKQYKETKGLSVKEQIRYVREKAEKLQKKIKTGQRSTIDNAVHV